MLRAPDGALAVFDEIRAELPRRDLCEAHADVAHPQQVRCATLLLGAEARAAVPDSSVVLGHVISFGSDGAHPVPARLSSESDDQTTADSPLISAVASRVLSSWSHCSMIASCARGS